MSVRAISIACLPTVTAYILPLSPFLVATGGGEIGLPLDVVCVSMSATISVHSHSREKNWLYVNRDTETEIVFELSFDE